RLGRVLVERLLRRGRPHRLGRGRGGDRHQPRRRRDPRQKHPRIEAPAYARAAADHHRSPCPSGRAAGVFGSATIVAAPTKRQRESGAETICIRPRLNIGFMGKGDEMSRPSRRSRGSLTIEDVARAAGVSAMTVSRVINKEKNVREETRQTVLETIERLNYSPNSAARNLAAGEATHIGLLYSNPSAAYLSQFLVGALEAARAAGCHLVIEACESEDDAEQGEVGRRFANAEAEGVILPPPLSESVPILTELAMAKTPVVTVAMGELYPNALNVRIDD